MLIAAHVRQQSTDSAINFIRGWIKGVADKLCVFITLQGLLEL